MLLQRSVQRTQHTAKQPTKRAVAVLCCVELDRFRSKSTPKRYQEPTACHSLTRQSYEKSREMQRKILFFLSFLRRSNFGIAKITHKSSIEKPECEITVLKRSVISRRVVWE